MKRAALIAGAIVLLVMGWAGALWHSTFWAHMSAHVISVSAAPPLLAAVIRWRPGFLARPAAVLPACGLELITVWGWHVPWLHQAARESLAVFAFEQTSFLLAGYAVWASAVPASPDGRGGGAALAGVGALLMTSMHMSLLGGLLAVSSGTWYPHGSLWDQQLGGVIMLGAGGLVYLAGALVLLARTLGRDGRWRGVS